MKELKAYQYHPQHGDHTIHARFDGHIIFLKVQSQSPIKNQMIQQFKSFGAGITESHTGWIRINLFKTQPNAKLGPVEVDIEEETKEVVEIKLYNFFSKKYKEAKYEVTGEEL